MSAIELLPFLETAVTFASFQSLGTSPEFKDLLKAQQVSEISFDSSNNILVPSQLQRFYSYLMSIILKIHNL